MNLNELCDEVNRILKDQKIMVADARTSSVLTPRNVRYYQTIGLLHPPVRRDGRAEYDTEHIDRLVEIKKAQHDGISLEEMQRRPVRIDYTPIVNEFRLQPNFLEVAETPTLRNILVNRSVEVKKSIDSSSAKTSYGWSVHFGKTSLSGLGNPPTQQQVEAIRKVLNSPAETDD